MKLLKERLVSARLEKSDRDRAKGGVEMTQDRLAELAGVSQSTIGNLESGARQTARKLATIAAVLEVNALWLAEGKGPRYLQSAGPEVALIYVTPEEIKLLTSYRKSNDFGQGFIRNTAEETAALHANKNGPISDANPIQDKR